MRTHLPAVAVLAVAALTLGACNRNTNTAANDTTADTAATMPAENTITPGMDTNVTAGTNTTVDTNTTMGTNTATNTATNTTY